MRLSLAADGFSTGERSGERRIRGPGGRIRYRRRKWGCLLGEKFLWGKYLAHGIGQNPGIGSCGI